MLLHATAYTTLSVVSTVHACPARGRYHMMSLIAAPVCMLAALDTLWQ